MRTILIHPQVHGRVRVVFGIEHPIVVAVEFEQRSATVRRDGAIVEQGRVAEEFTPAVDLSGTIPIIGEEPYLVSATGPLTVSRTPSPSISNGTPFAAEVSLWRRDDDVVVSHVSNFSSERDTRG
jgi:hypothetical protein